MTSSTLLSHLIFVKGVQCQRQGRQAKGRPPQHETEMLTLHSGASDRLLLYGLGQQRRSTSNTFKQEYWALVRDMVKQKLVLHINGDAEI